MQDVQVLEQRMMTRVLITLLHNVRAKRSSVDNSNHEQVMLTYFNFCVLICCRKLSLCLAQFTLADNGDSAISGAVLQPLDCWDRAFEFRPEHGCSCVVFVVCW